MRVSVLPFQSVYDENIPKDPFNPLLLAYEKKQKHKHRYESLSGEENEEVDKQTTSHLQHKLDIEQLRKNLWKSKAGVSSMENEKKRKNENEKKRKNEKERSKRAFKRGSCRRPFQTRVAGGGLKQICDVKIIFEIMTNWEMPSCAKMNHASIAAQLVKPALGAYMYTGGLHNLVHLHACLCESAFIHHSFSIYFYYRVYAYCKQAKT
ncbi:hypothetical protein POVWA2_040990 [Plasmodium ovale wallikeri]|uniref:Uncharacterized protein n=1 Tax=Plasmodium ovale wallikeri TaxID=864142 RepID=A0A1A8Z9W2_PLAOA|nr:hypothetical protein POVWA1_042490 [Plasmodium ovale wallikeri]SBT41005.1 hypothetical protein POVWA2_040990 [Plasmodium ovale wallikeri]